MLDIVDRLRNAAALPTGLYAEAADEITKLRGAVIVAREAFSKYADIHRAKGTREGDQKAGENGDLAQHMGSVLPRKKSVPT